MTKDDPAWYYYERVWEEVQHREFRSMKLFVLDVLGEYERLTSED